MVSTVSYKSITVTAVPLQMPDICVTMPYTTAQILLGVLERISGPPIGESPRAAMDVLRIALQHAGLKASQCGRSGEIALG